MKKVVLSYIMTVLFGISLAADEIKVPERDPMLMTTEQFDA